MTLVSANSSFTNGTTAGSGIGTFSTLARTRSHASSIFAAGNHSSSSTKMTVCSLLEVDRIRRTSSIPSMASSRGSVTSSSIFSADAPGQRAETTQIFNVNSGSSRRGIVSAAMMPQQTNIITKAITTVGRATAKAGRRFIERSPMLIALEQPEPDRRRRGSACRGRRHGHRRPSHPNRPVRCRESMSLRLTSLLL